jgi:hypothetical protein
MRTLFCSLPLRSAAAAAEEMVGLRAELSSVRQELESEKMNVRSLSTELATAHSATLRAEKQHEEILSVLEKRKHEMKEELKRVAYCHEEDIRKLKAEIRDLELDRRSGSQQTGEGVAARPVYNDSSQSPGMTLTATTTTEDLASPDRHAKIANASAIATFEKNLVNLRSKLRVGLKVTLWDEGGHVHAFKALLTLDRLYEALVFSPAAGTKSAFSMFSQRVEVEPIKIRDIDECCPGAAPDQSIMSVLGLSGQGAASDENAEDILVIKIGAKVVDGESLRVVSLKLSGRVERDFLHSAISTMISDMHVSRGKGSPSLSPSAAAGPVAINRPTQLNAAGQSLNKLAREVVTHSNADMAMACKAMFDTILHERSPADGTTTDSPILNLFTYTLQTLKAKEDGSPDRIEKADGRWGTDTNSDLQGQLQAERSNFAKVMQQVTTTRTVTPSASRDVTGLGTSPIEALQHMKRSLPFHFFFRYLPSRTI